jgi:hypothetical protein
LILHPLSLVFLLNFPHQMMFNSLGSGQKPKLQLRPRKPQPSQALDPKTSIWRMATAQPAKWANRLEKSTYAASTLYVSPVATSTAATTMSGFMQKVRLPGFHL